jgi:hypothetical protein
MTESKDPFNIFTDETLRRAEELCEKLSLEFTVDRRGRSTLYSGVMSYLSGPVWEHHPVTVAVYDENPWFTLISDRPLDAGSRVLLVFRKAVDDDVKLIGKLSESEHGRRHPEDAERYITRFDILRDR